MQAMPHLHFKGNCAEAFQFYAETFGGEIVFAMTYGESPAAAQTPAELQGKIIHARVDLGGQALLGADAAPERYRTPQGFNVMAGVDKVADAERIFNALAAGGSIMMPIQETFFAHRFGMCTDRFGIPWMVNCAKPPEALARSAGKAA